MRIVEFIVAGKPLAKGRVRFVRATGHAFTPERTVAYEGRVAAAAQAAMDGRPPEAGPVVVHLEVRLPIPSSWPNKKQVAAEMDHLRPTGKPDVDNYLKILDACNNIVWVDDSQVVYASVIKMYGSNPGITVTVDHWSPVV
jgi:Holliday junction resolvase RusA-like endonuclease